MAMVSLLLLGMAVPLSSLSDDGVFMAMAVPLSSLSDDGAFMAMALPLSSLSDDHARTPSITRFHLQCGAAWLQSKLNETKVGCCPVCNAAIVLPVMVEGTHYSSRQTLQHGMSSAALGGPGSTRVVLVLGTPCALCIISCIMGGLITLLVALMGGFSQQGD